MIDGWLVTARQLGRYNLDDWTVDGTPNWSSQGWGPTSVGVSDAQINLVEGQDTKRECIPS